MAFARIRGNPLSSVSLILLMAISSATAGAGVATLVSTIGATERLFALAEAPDAVQMHVGPLETSSLDSFAATHQDIVDDHQVQDALQLDNQNLRMHGMTDAARDGVMDLLLVTQSPRFDFLLGPDGTPTNVRDGEIAVPGYYADAYDLARGDTVEIAVQGDVQTFTVADTVSDAQMGPSLVNSKRFVVSERDWNDLAERLPVEHILTFRLVDDAGDRFAEAYRLAGLPANGAAVDGSLLRLIAALTDGLVAILTILVSIVLLAITLLCLRIMVLTALEQDARRIGVMRAIGFSHSEVSSTLLLGYAVQSGVAVLVALLLVFPASALLRGGDVVLSSGHGSTGTIVMLLAVVVASAIPTALAAQLLRRVRHISPLLALTRPGVSAQTRRRPRALRWDLPIPVSIRLAARGLTTRGTTAVLLIVMVGFAVALAGLPQRVTQTIAAPDFITTMGVGQSDLRAFVREGAEAGAGDALERSLRDDPDIARFAKATSFRVTLIGADHTDDVALEVGDTSAFPLAYARGEAPAGPGELALSTLAAQTAGVDVGQSVQVDSAGSTHRYRITGLYHDITNGGRSGKAVELPGGDGIPLWQTFMVDLRDGVDQGGKASALALDHPSASFTELDRFFHYTLGDTVERLKTASMIAGASAAVVILLVFALRGRLEATRDESDLRLLRLLGWSRGELRTITLFRAMSVAGAGLLLGWIATESLGPGVLGATLSSFGGGATDLVAANGWSLITGPVVAAAAVVGGLIASAHSPALLNES
ncbi:FtsX-like permease family protein [Microbacterium sp.]|uniref:FtsX-like permease family protein n=1 Tax=Microbacterium sp. TaxID=51671 RepID=UPI003A93530D